MERGICVEVRKYKRELDKKEWVMEKRLVASKSLPTKSHVCLFV